ncbi:Endonuclease/exonuclease/phosphatase [Blastocladiella britannica]|nr:Endonuclease/exonuclease/phosphatase [Blastocladiella britannica]
MTFEFNKKKTAHLADPNHPLSPPSSSGIVAVLKRKWLYHDRAPLDAHSFSVMSWNILAPSFERSNAPGSPSGPRPPSPPPSSPASRERRWAIVTEVLYYEADIVCLQEVDPSDFEAFFSPLLASAGYIGHYASKSAYDGCAMFYRADRFKLASAAPNTLRYRDVPLDGASLDRPDLWTSARPADACTRHSPFGNVAQIAVLRNLATGHRIRVINTHLLWQPELADAKLLQTAILMEHLVAGDVMARGACAGARGAPPSLPPSPALAASDEDELRAALAHRRLPLPIAIPEAAATIRSPPVAAAATVTGLPSPVSPWHPETLASHRAKSGGSAMSPLVIPSAYLPLTPPSPSFIPTSSSRRGTTTSGNKSPKPRHSNARSGSVSPVMRGGDHFARTGGGGTALPVPTVICGDFNSLPDSPVLQLLLAGWVPTEAFGGSQFGRFTCGERYEHSLGLRTAYEVTSLPYTHRVPHFSGMIDHILYSAGPGQLKLMGVLDSADPPGYLEQLESIPAPHVPSDHLPILSILRHQPGHASTSSTASARWH